MKVGDVDWTPELIDEIKFLLEYCIETKEREYADGTTYEVPVLRAGKDVVERLQSLMAKIEGK